MMNSPVRYVSIDVSAVVNEPAVKGIFRQKSEIIAIYPAKL